MVSPTLPHDRAASPCARGRRVVDAPTRVFHWLFAACFTIAYATGDGERWRLLHATLGWTMLGLLGWRLLDGLIGPPQVRLSAMARRLASLPAWLRTIVTRPTIDAATWRRGRALAAAASVVALLGLALPLAGSGWLVYEDLAGEALAELHEALGSLMLAVVLGHLGLVALASALGRENAARPMLTGHVMGTGSDLARSNRTPTAIVLAVAAVTFAAGSMGAFGGG